MKRTPHTILTSLAALALVGAAFTGTAGASGKAEAPGQAKKAEAPTPVASSTMTEDNDTNDNGTPNNVVDDRDNAHPSGKDRSVERGGAGTQGRSTSDPDDDGRGPDRSNGGADKADGPGGVDKADQDGNNGCGNDDDFEDDNEGWCGRKPKAEPAPQPAKPAEAKPAAGCPSGQVDMNGSKAGGCETPKAASAGCPSGQVDMNGSAAGGCETPKTASAAVGCPSGQVDMNGSEAGGCAVPPGPAPLAPAGEVLSGAAVSGPAASDCYLAAIAGTSPMPAGCPVPALASASLRPARAVRAASPAAAVGEVLGAGVEAIPVSLTTSTPVPAAVLSAATGGVAGALAFTGISIWTLLVAALLAIAAGLVIVRTDRSQRA